MLTSAVLALFVQAGPLAAPATDPAAAVVTVLHVAADGSEVLRGNGFLIGPDGVLVANHHVVVGASRLGVRLANGDVYDQVQVVALDPVGDIAVLKVPAFNTPFIASAPPGLSKPGDAVLVVPRVAPGGERVPRPAHLSASRKPSADLEVLVLDTPLDAFTKGCPVLDSKGVLLGVTTLTYVSGAGTGAAVGAGRISAALERRIDRPVDLVDWSAWVPAGDEAFRARLVELGLSRRFPDPQIPTERSLARRLELALGFDPTDMDARLLLARAYLQLRAYDKAMSQVDEVLVRQPSRLEARSVKGDVWHHMGAYDEARTAYQDVVENGAKPPHNYDPDLKGVAVAGTVHDHSIGSCQGALVLSPEELTYRPDGWINDRFTVRYEDIRRAVIKPAVKAGQSVHEFKLEFARPVANREKTWVKKDTLLRLADTESRENVAAYLRKKGVAVAAE